MYYFGYCTYLLDAELRKYLPEAVPVTKATAPNHQIQFRAAGDRTDRGWCHLADVGTLGKTAQGIVFEVNDDRVNDDFDDFDIVFLTGIGEVFPYIRSHNVLNNLQSVVVGKPMLMFFPGRYEQSDTLGSSLVLFGRLKDDQYYRAKNILEQEP